jgi:hypothetical protein
MSGSLPKNRKALCHPKRKHFAKDLCQECYQQIRNAKQNDAMAGLVRTSVPGWGCISP